MKAHAEKLKIQLGCHFCSFSSKFRKTFQKHMMKKHILKEHCSVTEDGKIKCENCDFTPTSKEEFEKHAVVHLEEFPGIIQSNSDAINITEDSSELQEEVREENEDEDVVSPTPPGPPLYLEEIEEMSNEDSLMNTNEEVDDVIEIEDDSLSTDDLEEITLDGENQEKVPDSINSRKHLKKTKLKIAKTKEKQKKKTLKKTFASAAATTGLKLHPGLKITGA